MMNSCKKQVKLSSVNKSIISKTKIKFHHNDINFSNQILNQMEKSSNENIDKKQLDIFPKIETLKLKISIVSKTKFFNFKKANILKTNKNYFNISNELSIDNKEKINPLLNQSKKRANLIPLVSFSKIDDMISSNESPQLNINDKNNISNNIIYPKNIALIHDNSKHMKNDNIGYNQSIVTNSKKNKLFTRDVEKEDNSIQQFMSNNQMSNSFIHKNKTASPWKSFRKVNKSSKDYFSSGKVNRLKSTQTTKITFESLEELHYIYNNLYHQNRVLAYKLDFEEKNDSNVDIEF